VEKIIQSVDLFFPVQLIVSLIVYQHVNYFFQYSALHPCCAVTSSGEKCMWRHWFRGVCCDGGTVL